MTTMYLNTKFGGSIASSPNKHIIAYENEGHFLDEVQAQNQKPYGVEIVVYDDLFNEVDSFHFKVKLIDGWSSIYPNPEYMFITKDKWLVIPDGYIRRNVSEEFMHYGRAFSFIDLDNLESLQYDETNYLGDTYTYTNASFVVLGGVPRYNFDDGGFQIAKIGGKEKIITSAFISYPNMPMHGDTESFSTGLYIQDIDQMIAVGTSSPLGSIGLVAEPELIPTFVGDGTTKQVVTNHWLHGTYTTQVTEGIDTGGEDRYLPNLSVGEDKVLVSDASKTHVYEYVNQTLTGPVVISEQLSGGVVNQNQYHVQDLVHYDISGRPSATLKYQGDREENGVTLLHPFSLTEPDNYPNGISIADTTLQIESGPRRVTNYNPTNGYRLPGWEYWVAFFPRTVSLNINFNLDGTYLVTSSSGDIDSGVWLERSVYSGEQYEITGVISKINDVDTNIFLSNFSTASDGESFAPNIKLTTTSNSLNNTLVTHGVRIEEYSNDPDHLVDSLHLDPSVVIPTKIEMSFDVEGLSSVSDTHINLTVDMDLSGVPDLDLSSTSPLVIFSTSFGLAYEGDSSTTFYAIDSMKPKVHVPDNDAGYTDELLVVDKNLSSSVDFMYVESQGPAAVTLQFPTGWVDENGSPLSTVEAQNGSTYTAYLGDNVYVGDDISVTASSYFENVDMTFTKTIPIQLGNLV